MIRRFSTLAPDGLDDGGRPVGDDLAPGRRPTRVARYVPDERLRLELGLEPSVFLRDARGLGAVAYFELLNCRGEVVSNGAFGQEEAFRDLSDAGAALAGHQDLALTFGQRADPSAERGGRQSGIDDTLARHGAP